MKQQKPQSKWQQNGFAFLKIAPFFLLSLISCLVAQAQTADVAPEIRASTNQKAEFPPLVVLSITKNNEESVEPNKNLASISEPLVHSGDTLEVDVLGSLDYDWRGTTDDEGFLSHPPYFSIFALCRTEKELASEIADAYSKLIRNPKIVVRVLDRSARQPAVLLGAVRLPQRFQIQRPVQLHELLVMSGGITDKASGDINIFRPAHASCAGRNQDQAEPAYIKIKLTDLLSGEPVANPSVRTGDIVTIEEAAPIYVTGGVVAPQQILFRQGMSLVRAVASAGGLNRNANPNKVTIYRRQKNQSNLEIIETDFEKVTIQGAEDILLQAYDIVEVAQTGRLRGFRPPVTNEFFETKQFDINKLPLRLIN